MSIESVNLLRERVIRAAIDCVKELEEREAIVTTLSHTKATRALVRTVKALQEETWRQDEAPVIIKELLALVELLPATSSLLAGGTSRSVVQESMLRAKAFLGERKVDDDTAPVPKPRRGILRRAER